MVQNILARYGYGYQSPAFGDGEDVTTPLSQQSEKVRGALQNGGRRWLIEDGSGTGGWTTAATSAGVADKLREAGIPGIKYLDEGSRNKGDDSLIQILRKYGLLPPVAAGAVAASSDDQAQAKP